MSILYSETFAGASANPIGGVWTTVSGESAMERDVTTSCAGASAASNCGAYTSTVPPNNQYAKLVYNSATTQGDGGPIVRAATGAETFYLADFDRGSSFLQLYLSSAGTFTPLGTGAAWSHVNGDVLEIRAIGTTISIWLNGVQKDSVTDSSLTSGRFGMFASGGQLNSGGMHYTSFEGGDFAAATILAGASSRSPFGKVGMNIARPGSQAAFMGSQTVVPTVASVAYAPVIVRQAVNRASTY